MNGQAFEDIYDAETIRVIDGWSPRRRSTEPVPRWRRGAAAGALSTALIRGVRDAVEEEPEPAVVEVDSVRRGRRLEPVTLHFVPGEPRSSVAIVRPWLL